MAVIFTDGASTYDSNASAAIAKNHTMPSLTGIDPVYRQAGAWGAGSYAVNFSSGAYLRQAVSGLTYTAGCRIKQNQTGVMGVFSFEFATSTHYMWAATTSGNPANITINGHSVNAFSATSTGTITPTSWNYIELQVTAIPSGGGGFSYALWINGIADISGTAGGNTESAIVGIDFGLQATYSAANISMTDMYITDTTNASGAGNTGNLGPVRVETLAPNGAGSNTMWTPVGANSASANQFLPTATTGFVADTNVTLSNTTMTTAASTVGSTNYPEPHTDNLGGPGVGVLTITPSSTTNAITSTAGTGGWTAIAGNSYTVSLIAGLQTGGGTLTYGIRWYTSGGTVISTSTTTGGAAGWTVLGVTFVAPATTAFAALYVSNSSSAAFYLNAITFVATPTVTGGWSGPIIKSPSLGAGNWGNTADAIAGDGEFNRDPGTAANIGDVDTYVTAALASTSGTPLAISVTDVAMKETTNPRSVAPVLRYGAGAASGVRYTEVSGTNTTDRVMNATFRTLKHLSDDTAVWLETDGTNLYLMYSFDHQTTHQIASLSTSSFWIGGITCLDLVRDAQDNLYVIGVDSTAQTTLAVKAFTKGVGYSWTAQTTVTSATVLGTAQQKLVCEWVNTTGGTGGHGHLIVFTQGTASHYGQVLDAGVALAGTGTLLVNAYTSPTCTPNGYTTAYTNNMMDMSADGFGAMSGLVLVGTGGGGAFDGFHIGGASVGGWSVSSVGVLTVTLVSTDATHGANWPAAEGSVRLSHFGAAGSGQWNIYWQLISSFNVLLIVTSVTGTTLIASGYTNSSWGSTGSLPVAQWDVYHDPSANKDWFVRWNNSGGNQYLAHGGVVFYSGTNPWDASMSNLDQVLTTGYTFGYIRCSIAPIVNANIDIQFGANSGTTYALYGDWTGTGTVPGNFVGTSQALNNDLGYHAFQSIWEVNPATSAAWSINQANSIEVGIEISA